MVRTGAGINNLMNRPPILFLLLLYCGLVTPAADRWKKTAPPKGFALSLTPQRLDEMDDASRAFADRFVSILSDACDVARKEAVPATAAREALRLKLHDCSSVYSIATSPNPLSQLLNLTTLSTLAYVRWVKEEHAKEVFGASGTTIEAAFTEIHDDIWNVAARFFSPQELGDIRQIILDWRRKHPQDRMVAYIRFDDFASGTNAAAASQSAKGFFAQVAEANRNMVETRDFAERAFFYAKRAPRLLSWQTERTSEALLENPDVSRLLDDAHETTAALREVATEIRRVDERYGMITGILARVEGILDRADRVGHTVRGALQESEVSFRGISEASASLNETLNTVTRLYTTIGSNKTETAKPSEPFDIRNYSAAATELARASQELNTLVRDTEGMIASAAWTRRLSEINNATQQRVNHVSWRAVQLILLFFALLAVHSIFVHRLRARSRYPEATTNARI